MIKNVKLFVNNNEKSIENSKIIRKRLSNSGFIVHEDDKFELGIAIGGDGSFLRMVKSNNFNNNIYYIGINSGHLGFLQEVTLNDLDIFIDEIKNDKYKTSDIDIQNTIVYTKDNKYSYNSLNEMEVRSANFDAISLKVLINNKLLEMFRGDGLIVATTLGSTAHNLGYGGSIVDNTFSTLQITSMGPLSSKSYRSLIPSYITSSDKIVNIIPLDNNEYNITIDGVNNMFDNIESIETKISDKKLKCLRLSHYSFEEKINDKLLSN